MTRQQRSPRGERKKEDQRKVPGQDAVRSVRNDNGSDPRYIRNRADNTRIAKLDPHRLNDLYERSSI